MFRHLTRSPESWISAVFLSQSCHVAKTSVYLFLCLTLALLPISCATLGSFSHSDRKRNLFEACLGFGGSVGSGDSGGGGLLGGLLGGANRSQTQLNEPVTKDNNGLAQKLDKDQLPNTLPETGNRSVGTNIGGLARKLQEEHARSGKVIIEPSDANLSQGQMDGLVGNVLENSGTKVTSDLRQNVQGINKDLLGGSTADESGLLTSGFLENVHDNSTRVTDLLTDNVPGLNSEVLDPGPTEGIPNNDQVSVSGFVNDISRNNSGHFNSGPTKVSYSSNADLSSSRPAEFHGDNGGILGNGLREKPLENMGIGLVSGRVTEYPRKYSTLVVSIEVAPCNLNKCLITGFISHLSGHRTTNTSSGQRVDLQGNSTERLVKEFHRKLGNVSRSFFRAHPGGSTEHATGGGGNGSGGGLLGGLLGGGGSGGGLLGGLLGGGSGGGGGGNSNTGGSSSGGGGGGGGGLLGGLLGGGSGGGLVGGLLGRKRANFHHNLQGRGRSEVIGSSSVVKQ